MSLVVEFLSNVDLGLFARVRDEVGLSAVPDKGNSKVVKATSIGGEGDPFPERTDETHG